MPDGLQGRTTGSRFQEFLRASQDRLRPRDALYFVLSSKQDFTPAPYPHSTDSVFPRELDKVFLGLEQGQLFLSRKW